MVLAATLYFYTLILYTYLIILFFIVSIYLYALRSLGNEQETKKKGKKNKKKSQDNEGETDVNQTVSAKEAQNVSTLDSDKKTNAKSSKVRTFANGLVVEELSMGKPDGKKALIGKQVSLQVTNFSGCEVPDRRNYVHLASMIMKS